MANHTTEQSVLFDDLLKKPVLSAFDRRHSSSDGGAVLLGALDRELGLSARLADCLSDGRQASQVEHGVLDMLRQRMFAIACGHPDGADAGRLADDPALKLAAGRDPARGAPLASQPTLSRFENSVGPRDLLRMSEALGETVIERHRRRREGGRPVRRITIDMDPTVDPTHGGQQLSLFNGHYDTWCYLPLACFLSFDKEPDQHLFAYVLRGGTAPAKRGCLAVLKRLLPRLREAFPKARIRVRLDGGFAGPELFGFFEAEGLEYVVGLAKNKTLEAFAEEPMEEARDLFRESGETARVHADLAYRARSWPRERRVVVKAEVVGLAGREPKDNPRFVVTNLRTTAKHVYRTYAARGDSENRIKELKRDMEIDRTGCPRFAANQFRALVAAAAYVLMQEIRLRAAGTGCAKAQAGTLRLRLLKVAAWIESSVRRVVVHLPEGAPFAADWLRVARSIGAAPT